MKTTIILDNTGIKNEHSNGARTQTVLFKTKEHTFRITIKSESYDFQSYARLSILSTDKKWTVMKSAQPKRDYFIDISYQDNYNPEAFNKIIKEFMALAEKI